MRAELISVQAKAKAEALAEAFMKTLKAPGANLTALAASQNLVVTTQAAAKRTTEGLEPELLKAAFALPRPAAGTMSYGKVALPSRDVVVIALQSVTDAKAAPADEAFQRASAQVKDALAGVEFAGFKSSIEKAVGVGEKKLSALNPVDPVAP